MRASRARTAWAASAAVAVVVGIGLATRLGGGGSKPASVGRSPEPTSTGTVGGTSSTAPRTAVGRPGSPGATPGTGPTAGGPNPAGTTQPGGLKPVTVGLLDRSAAPAAAYDHAVGGWVIEVYWADLQPTQDGPIVSGNKIDRAIAQARQLAAADPSLHPQLKLRVLAGIHSPEWAKTLDGPPVTVSALIDHRSGTAPRFWTDNFARAYAGLQRRLAARYDAVPEILSTVVSQCTTVYAEPFQRQTDSAQTVQDLDAAGFTQAADLQCYRTQIAAQQVWQRTRSELAFNPYEVVDPSGQSSPPGQGTDEAITDQMISYCRIVLGPRCVVANESIRWPPLGSYLPMYSAIRAAGPPIAFQTAIASRVHDLGRTLSWAIAQGASSVELPDGYQTMSPSVLQGFATGLSTNPT